MKKRRHTSIYLAGFLSFPFLFFFILSCASLQTHSHPRQTEFLTILYLNDLHGQLEPFSAQGEKMAGGAARLASLIEQIREENRRLGRPTLFLVAGDLFLGSSLEEGAITPEDIWRVFPYDSQPARLVMAGSQIEEVLNHSASLGPGLTGGFLQLSGLSFVIGPSGAQDVRVQGKPLQRKRFYSVAVTDFLLAGGDGYSHFRKGGNRLLYPILIRDLLLDYLRENKEVSPTVEGRIRRQP